MQPQGKTKPKANDTTLIYSDSESQDEWKSDWLFFPVIVNSFLLATAYFFVEIKWKEKYIFG